MSSDEARKLSEEEYGAQFHRCSALTVHNNVVKLMKWAVEEAVKEMVKKIKGRIPECDAEATIAAVTNEFFEAFDGNQPELKAAIKESLRIPDNVLLPEDAVQKKQYTDQEIKDLQETNSDLKRRFLYNEQLKKVLSAETKILGCFSNAETELAEWQELCQTCERETRKVEEAMNLLMSLKDHGVKMTQRSSHFLKEKES